MNKMLLSLLALSSSLVFATVPDDSYAQARENFKADLFVRQHDLMKRDKYDVFIERVIQEAENTLGILKYCKDHADLEMCQSYFNCLLGYNIACFQHYIKPTPITRSKYEHFQDKLADIIEHIKQKGGLTDLNLDEELRKTCDLLYRFNVRFYKKLSFTARCLVMMTADHMSKKKII